MKYEFSAPMPFETENIDKLLDINNKIEKSRITALYASLPSTCELFTGFEQYRNCSLQNNTFDYWKRLINQTFDKNCDFIYLLNSPSRLQIENSNFSKQLEKLDKLLNEFRKTGVNKLRVSNHKLLSYIHKHYGDFNLYASTSFEFKMLSEYRNFMFIHPYIKQIVPSHDTNKNFRLLKNLKKMLPDVDIEIMVNEGCINGCPVRKEHAGDVFDENIIFNDDNTVSNSYCSEFFCQSFVRYNLINAFIKSNNIFPWQIKEYEKIGITKFKLVGRDSFNYDIENKLKQYYLYLKGIDNFKYIENKSVNNFTHHYNNSPVIKQLTVKDVKKYLPGINYFKKYGEFCSSDCGVNCRYCYNCANKIQKFLEKKMLQNSKRPHYVPACKIS